MRKCLAKDPNDRYHTTDELKAALQQIALRQSDPATSDAAARNLQPVASDGARARVRRAAVLIGAVLAVAVGLTWWAVAHRTDQSPRELSFRQITSLGNVIDAALSPDGRSLAFVTDVQGDRRLMMRDLAGGPAIQLARGAGLMLPVWSRDGAEINYATRGGGFTVSRLGGEPRKSVGFRPITWAPDGSQMATASLSAPVFSIVTPDGRRVGDFKPVEHARFMRGIDWHVKSNRLLLLGIDDEGHSSIWIAAPDGGNVRRVFSGAEHIESAFWNPTADSIYAFKVRNLSSDLIALDVGDTGPATSRVLAAGLPLSAMAGISADGGTLLQVRGVISTNLWVVDLGGAQPAHRPVTTGTGFFSDPDISPDGRWVAAVFELGSKTTIVKIPTTGGEPVPLISGESTFASPSWSPDGSQIAFGSNREGGRGIWLMDADGGQLRKLETPGVSTNLLVTWTPDGRIAWQQFTDQTHMNFRVRDLKTGDERFIANPTPNGWMFFPFFSPAGNHAVFRWNDRPPTNGIYVVPWPDGAPRLLTQDPTRPLGWSPDGSAVYTVDNSRTTPVVSIIDVTSGKSRDLTKLPVGVIVGGTASHDGRMLVLTVQEQTGDAWLLEYLNGKRNR